MEQPLIFPIGFILIMGVVYFVGYIARNLVEKIPQSKRRMVVWSIPFIVGICLFVIMTIGIR